MRSRIVPFALAAVISVMVLPGCSKLRQFVGGVPTATPPAWQVGVVGASWGPAGLEGSYSGNGAQLAMEQINARGGIPWHGQHYHLTPAYSGAQAPADRVRDLVFRNPPIVALLGPDESDAALAALPLAQGARIPMLTLAGAPELTDPAKNQSPQMLFRMRSSQAASARAVATYAAQHSNGPLVLAVIDNDYGHTGASIISSALSATHVTPAASVMLPPGLDDPSTLVEQAMAAHPGTILCWSTEAEAARFLSGLRVAGWPGQFILGQMDPDFIALAGSAAEGAIGAEAWYPQVASQTSQQFVAAYVQRFGMQPDEHAAAMYDAVQILAAALAAVGPNHDALARYLADLNNFAGVAGTYGASASQALGTSGDLISSVHLVRVQSGQVSEINS